MPAIGDEAIMSAPRGKVDSPLPLAGVGQSCSDGRDQGFGDVSPPTRLPCPPCADSGLLGTEQPGADALAQERHRFASYLHDGPCQSVSVLANLAFLIASSTRASERSRLLDRLGHAIEGLAAELRGLVRQLRSCPHTEGSCDESSQ